MDPKISRTSISLHGHLYPVSVSETSPNVIFVRSFFPIMITIYHRIILYPREARFKRRGAAFCHPVTR